MTRSREQAGQVEGDSLDEEKLSNQPQEQRDITTESSNGPFASWSIRRSTYFRLKYSLMGLIITDG